MEMGWVHPWVGLGWVKKNGPMSISVTDDVDGATSATPSGSTVSDDDAAFVPTLRLCELVSWASYAGGGYGFEVVTDKRRPSSSQRHDRRGGGHFIGKVRSSTVTAVFMLRRRRRR